MNYNIRQLLPIEPTQGENESIRFVLIGSRNWITETIHTLHHLGFAEAGLWSPIRSGSQLDRSNGIAQAHPIAIDLSRLKCDRFISN